MRVDKCTIVVWPSASSATQVLISPEFMQGFITASAAAEKHIIESGIVPTKMSILVSFTDDPLKPGTSKTYFELGESPTEGNGVHGTEAATP